MDERTIPLPNILVVRRAESGWFCEQEGQPLFIARGQVALRVPFPAVGTRGTVVVRAFAIRDLYPDDLQPRRESTSP